MIIVIVLLANINLSSLFATKINYSLKTSLSLPFNQRLNWERSSFLHGFEYEVRSPWHWFFWIVHYISSVKLRNMI